METENQSSFILPMPQDFPSGIADEDTVIPFIEDTVTPMTIDASAPGDVIELRDDFDFDGYQVVRREFFAHTFEPSITFNNYTFLRYALAPSQSETHSRGATHLVENGNLDR